MASLDLHLLHCQNNLPPEQLTEEQRDSYLNEIPHWNYEVKTNHISRQFSFEDYYQTLAFINACAWIAHQENHHPEINFSYNKCSINFTTHSAHGITLFDFICAAQIDQL